MNGHWSIVPHLKNQTCPQNSFVSSLVSRHLPGFISYTDHKKQKGGDSAGLERPRAKEARKERKVLEKKMALNRKRKLDSRYVVPRSDTNMYSCCSTQADFLIFWQFTLCKCMHTFHQFHLAGKREMLQARGKETQEEKDPRKWYVKAP